MTCATRIAQATPAGTDTGCDRAGVAGRDRLHLHDAREEFDEVLDAHLAQAAALLLVQTARDLDELETNMPPLLHKYSRRVAFQVWKMASASACIQPAPRSSRWQRLKTVSATAQSTENAGAYSAAGMNRHLPDPCRGTRRRARRTGRRHRRQFAAAAAVLAAAAGDSAVGGRGARPATSGHTGARGGTARAGNLAALDASAAPREVLPLIERLNHLFTRIAVSLQKERSFTADAAHELRTPIAAIKRRHSCTHGRFGCGAQACARQTRFSAAIAPRA